MSLADRLQEARTAHMVAVTTAGERGDELKSAVGAELAAQKAYDISGSERDLEKVSAARLRRERAERIAAAAKADERNAFAACTDHEREAKRKILAAKIAEVQRWPGAIAPLVAGLREVDVKAAALGERIATVLVGVEDAYREAKALAEELGDGRAFQTACVKPSVKKARYLANVAVQRARDTENRESGADWIVGVKEPDWKDVETTAYRDALAQITKGTS